MNFERIYRYRFQGIDAEKKRVAWSEISHFVSRLSKNPQVILDPAAGQCEFINAIPGHEKWAVDMNEVFVKKHADPKLKIVIGDILKTDLPENYFDLIFVSNFLEHLHSQEEVAAFLERMHRFLKPEGFIVIIGPNFKYTYRQYFDFADHTVILSEMGLAEHLYGAGFSITKVCSRFLPLSFRGSLPVNRFLIRLYLRIPFFWKLFGKQFLVIGQK